MRSILLVLSIYVLFFSCNQQPSAEQATEHETGTTEKNAEPAENNHSKAILFFGNSITAGLGLALSEAFPAQIQIKIDSLKKPYHVVNAGLSGETSAGGLTRIDCVLKQTVDIFVLELGANDGLRGLGLDQTAQNLQMIIDKVKVKYPNAKIVLAGMQMPPSMGKGYTEGFGKIFSELAKKNEATLIPFLLDKVAGEPSLNQQDGIHPNLEGEKIVTENVWKVLKNIL